MSGKQKRHEPSPGPGYSLSDAAWRYAADIKTGRRFLDLFWRSHIKDAGPDSLSLDDLHELVHLESIMEAGLLAKLRGGELEAYWHPAGSTQQQAVETSWWIGARLNFRMNQAESNGTMIEPVVVAAIPAPIVTYKTGVPGKPTSRHLWVEEFRARVSRGEVQLSLAAESRQLAEWLKQEHPTAAPATSKTIQEAIRREYRRFEVDRKAPG